MQARGLPYLLLSLILLALALVSCELQRSDDAGDIARSIPEIAPPGEDQGTGFRPPEAAQTGNAIIRLQPASQQIAPGATTVVEIIIANVTDLAAADVELRFNPGVLQVQDADPEREGIQIASGDFLRPDFVANNEVDNSSGVIRYIVTQVGNIPPASGEGRLASISFQATNQGLSDIPFTIAKLASNSAIAIPVTPETGQIMVGEGQPTVEPTIEPTGEPTTEPTAEPTVEPTAEPTVEPTTEPTVEPTAEPTVEPTTEPTVVPPLTKIPHGATYGFCYRVRYGEENIYYLADKFGITPYAINLVNDLHPPSYIFTHQILFMPEELGHGPNVYRIREGDSLTSIAAECHLTAQMLIKRNYLDPEIDPDAPLPAGQALKIPIPYFPPPSRFEYPMGPIPVVPVPSPCCARPPYRPGPPVYR